MPFIKEKQAAPYRRSRNQSWKQVWEKRSDFCQPFRNTFITCLSQHNLSASRFCGSGRLPSRRVYFCPNYLFKTTVHQLLHSETQRHISRFKIHLHKTSIICIAFPGCVSFWNVLNLFINFSCSHDLPHLNPSIFSKKHPALYWYTPGILPSEHSTLILLSEIPHFSAVSFTVIKISHHLQSDIILYCFSGIISALSE